VIPELEELSYAESLDWLNMWTLKERHVLADLIEVYRVVRGLSLFVCCTI